MRLLVCPTYEFMSQPGADSTFLWNRDLIRLASQRGWFSYFVTPTDEATDGLTERLARLVPGPEQYIRLVMGGRDAGIYVTYAGGARRFFQTVKKLGGQKVIEAMTNVAWHDSLQLMTRCHASVFYQSLKLTPTACFEQLYAGLVVLIRRTGVEAEFLPPDYPFLFDKDEECATMLRWVYEHYDEAREKVAHVPDWVRPRFDRPTGINKLLEYVEDAVTERRASARSGYRELKDTEAAIGAAIRAVGTPCSYEQLGMALKRLKPNLLIEDLSSTRGNFLMHLTQNFMPAEFRDDCLHAEPQYVEVG